MQKTNQKTSSHKQSSGMFVVHIVFVYHRSSPPLAGPESRCRVCLVFVFRVLFSDRVCDEIIYILCCMIMIEKEVKILDVPYALLCERLLAVGAKKRGQTEIHDRYCDTKDGKLDAKGMKVRVRQEGENAVITTKSRVKKGEKG